MPPVANAEDCHTCRSRGRDALANGLVEQAAGWFQRAVTLAPGDAAAHNDLGEALRRLRRTDAALGCFERAVGLKHDYIDALVNLGSLNAELGHEEDAADAFNLAAAFDPGAIAPCLGLARLERAAGRLEESVALLEAGVAEHSNDALLHFELGLTRSHMDDTNGAMLAYERAVALDSAMAAAWANLGLVHLSDLGDAVAAEFCFRRALAADPQLEAANANLGLALQEQGRFEEALRHYETSLAQSPSDFLRWHRGIARLTQGRFAEGWDDYEARKAQPAGLRKFPFREWDGAPLVGKSILVYAEQGLGDEIMFASCLPDVLAQAGRCIIECDPRLVALYRRSFPNATVHGALRDGNREWLHDHPEIELQSAIGSLPRYLRRDVSAFPAHSGYLAPEPARVASWRRELGVGPGTFTVGLAWRGGTRKTRRLLRSLDIPELAPLLAAEGARFVNLQRGATDSEIREIEQIHGRRVHRPDPPPVDIDEFAALLSAVDIVVSVDSTVVHLAGACGAPVWALLHYSAEWRYPWGQGGSPWYPSLRTFRQGPDRRWEPAVLALVKDLEAIKRCAP